MLHDLRLNFHQDPGIHIEPMLGIYLTAYADGLEFPEGGSDVLNVQILNGFWLWHFFGLLVIFVGHFEG